MERISQQLNPVLDTDFAAGRAAAKRMEDCYKIAKWVFEADFEDQIAEISRFVEAIAARKGLSILATIRLIEAKAKAAGVLTFCKWVMLNAAAYSLMRPMFEN